jgi:hypothetical protein
LSSASAIPTFLTFVAAATSLKELIMHVDLSGRRGLVTGSIMGIGRALTHKLAASGAEVKGSKSADVVVFLVSRKADGSVSLSIE